MRGVQAGAQVAQLERQIASLQAQLDTERKRTAEATARTAELERLYQTASQTAVLRPAPPFSVFPMAESLFRLPCIFALLTAPCVPSAFLL